MNEALSEIFAKYIETTPQRILSNRKMRFDEWGADSLDKMEILTEAEEKFNVILSSEEFNRLQTFDDVLFCLENKTKHATQQQEV